MRSIADTLARYAACVSAGDVEGIVGLYAADASIEIPVGGTVHRGIAAIRAFYTEQRAGAEARDHRPRLRGGTRSGGADARAHRPRRQAASSST